MAAALALLGVAAALLGTAALCAGSSCLQQPRNVTVDIVNTNIFLKWDWDNPCDLNVTFSAEYQEINDYETIVGNWTVISGCRNVIVKECNLSFAIPNYFSQYTVNVRVESGEDHSPWTSLKFCPYVEAKIGPPGLRLESEGGEVKISILHPEANQARKMWDMDTLSYKLAIWKNSSNPEEKTQDIFSGQTIHDLEPETTYCSKIKAHLPNHIALFSPVECIRTPSAWVGLPRPQNLQFHALDMKCLLYWDNLYNENVTFMVQLLYASKRSFSPDISKHWIPVSGCENITMTHCDFSCVDVTGIYYLRVQAMNGHNKSLWSKEREFELKIHNEMGPPSVYVNASEDSLYIFVSHREMYKKLYGDLSYRIWYWKNSSYTKEKIEDKSTPFTISGLTPSTLYCLKVQAYPQNYNKSSKFSNVTCIATATGISSYQTNVEIGLVFLATMGSLIVAVLLGCTVYYLWRKLKDVFFPSCSLPSNIEKIEGKEFSSYLITAEEPTEKSVVIIDSCVPNEVNLIDFKDHKQLEQISEDSGNYSNDDISGSKQSHGTLEPEIQ
ncbi:interferon alpha/beta receptor 1 [Tiliqua scincoides]|uniref:interferon alpha/beta receptor 1 n=1 Tax=Tiliqua scincoides TaxID=71010 RepID=UPI003461B44B